MTETQRNIPPEIDDNTLFVECCTECGAYFLQGSEIDSKELPNRFNTEDIVCEYCKNEIINF